MREKIMTAEILYLDYFLFADSANAAFLQNCLTDWDFIYTDISDKPYFADNEPDFIYMGGMSESNQNRVIQALMPYKERLRKLIDKGTYILFTANACDILGNYIEDKKNTTDRVAGLGIFDFHVETDMFNRFNGMTLGDYDGIEIVGYLSQFGRAYPAETEKEFFVPVIRGSGLNEKCRYEGFKRKNCIATYLIGPFLVMNPPFTKKWLAEIAGEPITIPYENEAFKVYEQRLAEFKDPNREII